MSDKPHEEKKQMYWIQPAVQEVINRLGEELGLRRATGTNKSAVVQTSVMGFDESRRVAKARGDVLRNASDDEARALVRAGMHLERGDREAVRKLFDFSVKDWEALVVRAFHDGDLDQEWPAKNEGA